nr:glycosyltransferase [Paenibacillus sp. MMS18-CY102]
MHVLELADLRGIVNGYETSIWHPELSEYVIVPYNKNSVTDKLKNKKWLIKELRLEIDETRPILLFLGRLSPQKGIELFYNEGANFSLNIEALMALGAAFIVCGEPQENEIDKKFQKLAMSIEGDFRYIDRYTEELAHRLLAGSDILVHPSKFEPCGLTQLYAMAYGTIPIVNPVGGLKDTIVCELKNNGQGCGFWMEEYSFKGLYDAIETTIFHYEQTDVWSSLIERAMSQQYDWDLRIDPYVSIISEHQRSRRREL